MNTIKVDCIDFVSVIFKRVEYAKLIHESIKRYVDYPYKYYIVNNGDNSVNSEELKKLHVMFENEPNVVIVNGLHQVNIDDGLCVPAIPSQSKYPQQYFIDNYGWDGYAKYDRRIIGFASWLQAEGMAKGAKAGNGKYICHIEHDVVFLNKWTDDILPLLEHNSFISYGWRHDIDQALSPQWSVIKRETVENNFYKEVGDLHPNCHYKDTYGLLSLWARETNNPFLLLENSFENKKLKSNHILKFPYGDEGFINGIPFLHHAGRGAIRSEDIVQSWISEVSDYLDITT
tara:strand:- start:3881 stop:4744 length:864 start_codon:yes stop_codon:yes gene_type:complete